MKSVLTANRFTVFVCFVFFAVFVFPVRSASAATCESIAALSLPNAKINAAEQVAPGAFTPPGPTGPAPDMIPASHTRDGKVDRTRPLCPYPQVASYKGSGSIDDASNFVCK